MSGVPFTSVTTSNSNNNINKVNSSNSQPNISLQANSGFTGANSLQHYSSNTYTGGTSRSLKTVGNLIDPFANPYIRTSNNNNNNNGSNTNGLPMSHNGLENDRLLSAGVYNAHQHTRYKTNSLGGGSSSSGVVSTGGSSPGHSPVGSMSGGQAGTHV